MSITNHYILYFVRIWSTRPLNTAVCLWKFSNGLARCGISRSDHGKIRANRTFQQAHLTFLSLFPARAPHKAQKQCSFSDFPVQMWTFGAISRSSAPSHSPLRPPQNRPNCNPAIHAIANEALALVDDLVVVLVLPACRNNSLVGYGHADLYTICPLIGGGGETICVRKSELYVLV